MVPLIPLMITNAISGTDLPVYGDGSNVRDWLFVRDHCEAIQQSLIEEQKHIILVEETIANIKIVETICKILDSEMPLGNGKLYKEQIRYVKF